MKRKHWEKFRTPVAEEENSIARWLSLLPFHSSQPQTQLFSPSEAEERSGDIEREIQRESSSLVDCLWEARTDVPRERLSEMGLQVGSFLLDVAKSMDDLSVNRLLVVGEAYRANRMFEAS
jgi:hypothetical protein